MDGGDREEVVGGDERAISGVKRGLAEDATTVPGEIRETEREREREGVRRGTTKEKGGNEGERERDSVGGGVCVPPSTRRPYAK